jgi:hypothetical protein
MAGQRGFRKRIDVREAIFLANFYGKDSPTKRNGTESARAAGFPESFCETQWPRILRKFGDRGMKDSLLAVGITKPYIAMKIQYILENGKVAEMIPALRLALVGLGELTDNSAGSVNVNASGSGPVMVIVGATEERMKALKGAIPQLTRAQQEEVSNARSAARLEAFKRGEFPPLEKSENGKYIYRKPVEVLDVQCSKSDQESIDPSDTGSK